jgi:hypothetical protein
MGLIGIVTRDWGLTFLCYVTMQSFANVLCTCKSMKTPSVQHNLMEMARARYASGVMYWGNLMNMPAIGSTYHPFICKHITRVWVCGKSVIDFQLHRRRVCPRIGCMVVGPHLSDFMIQWACMRWGLDESVFAVHQQTREQMKYGMSCVHCRYGPTERCYILP